MIRVSLKNIFTYDNINTFLQSASINIDSQIIAQVFFTSTLTEYSVFFIDPKNNEIISNSAFYPSLGTPTEFTLVRTRLVIIKKYLYVLIENKVCDCFFIGDINNAQYIGRIVPGNTGEAFYRMLTDGANKLFFAGNSHISVFDVSNPISPIRVGFLPLSPDYYNDIVYYDNKLFYSATPAIFIYDVSGDIYLSETIINMDNINGDNRLYIIGSLLVCSYDVDSAIRIYDLNNQNNLLASLNFSFGWINSFCKFSDSFVFFTVYDYTTGEEIIYYINIKKLSLFKIEFEHTLTFSEMFINKRGNMLSISLPLDSNNYVGGEVDILVNLNIYGLTIESNGVPRITNFARYLTFGKGELN